MRKTNDSNGAESRKRRRESVSNGEEGSNPARQEGHRVPSTAKHPALEPKHAKSTITARMPTKLLTTNWSVGSKRLLNRRHVQQLKRAFVQFGGPKRDLEEHHLKVLCTGAQVHRMMKQLGSQDGTKQAGGMPDFTIWPDVNGREQLELLAGQHRVRALEEWVKEADLGEGELWWPCKFYDKDGISVEQNMKLRLNRKDVAHPDSHGDIWLQVVTAAAQKPEKFQGKACEITAEIVDTLELNLGSVVGRLVTLWRNEIWRKLVTQWCKTAVGRATFQIRAWSVMITCRIDDFWFSIFGQVLDTLAHLPGDAASYVTEEDWKQMSKCFEHGRSETQIRELFYPDRGSREVDQSCPRRADLLVLLDKEAYWQVYEHVVQREKTSFPHLHRMLSLKDQDGKILRGVMDHVVDWLSEDRSKRRNKRDNNKPGLRVDMVAALQSFDEKKLQEAKGRVTTSIGELGGQSIAEAASIVIQQEVLEFVCGRLETFGSASAKDQLAQRLDSENARWYGYRFSEANWAGVLDIVRWYMGPEFRPEWPRLEESRPGDVSHLVDMAIQNWRKTLVGDETRCSQLSSASFQDNLASLLAEQFGAGEESSPSGPTTGEANADAESITCTSAVSTRRDAGGEEDDCDPVRASDSAMARQEPISSPSGQMPKTVLEDGTADTDADGEDGDCDMGTECDFSMTQPEPLSSPSGQLPKTVLKDRTADTDAGGEDGDCDMGTECDVSMTQPEPLSSPSGQLPTAGTDAGGEDDDCDLGMQHDFAMAKPKKKTALSVPTQQAAPAKQRKAQPPFSPQPSCSGSDLPPKPTAAHRPSAANLPGTSCDLTSSPNARASGKRKRPGKGGLLCWFRP